MIYLAIVFLVLFVLSVGLLIGGHAVIHELRVELLNRQLAIDGLKRENLRLIEAASRAGAVVDFGEEPTERKPVDAYFDTKPHLVVKAE